MRCYLSDLIAKAYQSCPIPVLVRLPVLYHIIYYHTTILASEYETVIKIHEGEKKSW